jgi:ribonuclease BN (tRNA processing enzyme)
VDDRPRPDLTFTVLGCSGTYAEPGGACSGYLVRSPGATVVVDLGPGALANLQRHVELSEVDAVVLSHEHPDHWLDVPLLRNALRYFLELRDLPIYATAGTLRLARELVPELEPTLVPHTVTAASRLRFGDLDVRFSRTDHPVETLAVRVDSGDRSVLYSADTGPAWRADGAGEGVDTFVCEASFLPGGPGEVHLTARQAAELAREIGARRLVLTHVPPGVDPDEQRRLASAGYDGPIELATPGVTFEI